MLRVKPSGADASSSFGEPLRSADVSSFEPTGARLKRRSEAWSVQGLAASNVAVLTGELWPVKSAGATPELSAPTAPFLQVVEADFLSQIHDDLRSLDADSTSSETVALCEKFAEGVGIALARQAGTRVAVFAEEEGALTLMAHSSLSKRQVTFEFRSDRRITITSIDEGMRRTQLKCGPDHLLTLGNAIAWLSRPT